MTAHDPSGYARGGARRGAQAARSECAPSNFMGLRNQGATCYLNSLLQALYLTPEFRGGLYSVDPAALNVDLVRPRRRPRRLSLRLRERATASAINHDSWSSPSRRLAVRMPNLRRAAQSGARASSHSSCSASSATCSC